MNITTLHNGHGIITADGSGQDDTGLSWENYLNSNSSTANLLKDQLKMVNPIAYLNTTTDTAPYWYIRHGMLDRDTSFAMQMILYYAVTNDPKVKDTNFKLPYLIYAELSGDFPLGDSRQPIYKSLRPFDLVS
ncbi:hypothetical protein [Acinetobacter baumannii]|uniref:hypothetical protein n=1 Tax=Acinetobacter baumannii TaxID=470 RepID=UPI001D18525D|nr:hypothetical protein [Acinetobacter baumannii]